MIKINLLGDDTVIDTSGTWLIIGYGLSLVATLMICGFLYISVNSSIEELTSESESLEKRLTALQETTKEVRELEKKKKELADKTSVIAILKRNKMGPVRVLDDLNNAIPEKSWLVDLKESGGLARVTGLALDNQTIATFMKALESSNYFDNIDLGESRQFPKDGISIKQFTLQAKVNYAGFDKKKSSAPAEAEVTPAASPSPSPSSSPSPSPSPSAAATVNPGEE